MAGLVPAIHVLLAARKTWVPGTGPGTTGKMGMSAKIIDGKAIAQAMRARIAGATASLSQRHGLVPGLAFVLAGNNPASEVYVAAKSKAVSEAGMRAFDHKLPANITQADLLALISRLNADKNVHAILVQLPLPGQIDANAVFAAVDPAKDVDGFTPLNAGRLAMGMHGLVPCTPLACVRLAKSVHSSLAGMAALVVGRSNIVGKPLVQLLLAENATVTIAHSKTKDLPAACRRADLLFAAIGRSEVIRGDWIKPGATVIDVGINRVPGNGKTRLVGDVAFAEASEIAGAITPVPGGVGPMTIAYVLLNTLRAACASAGLPEPKI